MAYDKVIVFGATGGVGSNAALTAHQLGAKVVLALRDPKKPIPGLSAEQEQAGGFERVQADLTQPETVRAAAAQTGAKAAFIYLVHPSPDHQRGAIEALKAGGVELVVFLSSITVHGDPRAISLESGFIPFAHAQVEIALEEVFGKQGYIAVRPGYFASNLLSYKKVIAAGDVVRIPVPGAKFDFIAPEDIGRVSGTLLVKGSEPFADGTKEVFLAGPRLVTQAEVIVMLGKLIGRDLKVEGFDNEEGEVKFIVEEMHLPESAAKQMVKGFHEAEGTWGVYVNVMDEAIANVEKYGGWPALVVQEWLEAHSAEFK